MSESHRKPSKWGSAATPSLFFSGKGSSLPDHISKKDISRHFSDFESKIKRVVLFRDKSEKSQGRGFVEFESKEAAGEALTALRGVELMETIPIFLSYYTKRGRKKQNEPCPSTKHGQASVDVSTNFAGHTPDFQRLASPYRPKASKLDVSCKLFVSCHGQRFPDYIRGCDLKHHFKLYSEEVLNAYIARDSRTNRSQGFGYVEFASMSSAHKAKRSLSGSLLLDKFPIYIAFEKPVLLPDMVSKPFQCSSRHLLYLKSYFFVNPSKEADGFRTMLPAELTDKDPSISLCGSRDDVESSEQTINEKLLLNLGNSIVLLQYPSEFASLLGEDFLTRVNPAQDRVICILQDKSTESQKSSGMLTMAIHSFSQDPEYLQETTRKMKELKPISKNFTLHPESQSASGVEKCIALSSKKHLTIAEKTGRLSVRIRGFRVKDIQDTWREIKETVDNTVVTKNVSVSRYQLKYLQSRQLTCVEADSVIDFPVLPHPTSSPDDRPTFEITLKAKVCTIKRDEENIKKESCKCTVIHIQVSCPRKHLQPWKKRWTKFVEMQRTQNKVHIEYDCQTPSLDEESDECSVSFVLYGDNMSAITQAKHTIINEENGKAFTEHVINLSQKESDYIRRNVDSIRSDLEQSHQICLQLESCTESSCVSLCIPAVLNAEQLQEVEESILGRIRNSVTKKFRFADPVTGQAFLSKNISAVKESHETVTFSQEDAPELVLELEGLPTDVEDAERHINEEIKKLSLISISNNQLSLEKAHLPLLSSSQFASFISSLEKEHAIACTYPTIKTQEMVLEQMHLQTSTGHVVTIQLCTGSIFDENTAAVLTPLDPGPISPLPESTNPRESFANQELVKVKDLPSLLEAGEERSVPPQPQSQIDLLVNRGRGDTAPLALTTALEAVNNRRYGVISIPVAHRAILKAPSHVTLESVSRQMLSLSGEEMCDVVSRLWTKQVLDSVCSHAELHPDTTVHTVRLVVSPEESIEIVAGIFNSYSYTNANRKTVEIRSVVDEHPLSSPSDISTQNSTGKWYWQDDSGFYTEYDQDTSDAISSAWATDNVGICRVLINGQHYHIDFLEMTQTNLNYETKRPIKHEVPDKLSACLRASPSFTTSEPDSKNETETVQWTYQDDKGSYSPYSVVNSRKVEDMYQNRIPPCTLKINKWNYNFDFANMKQINSDTSTQRSIQRQVSKVVSSNSIDTPAGDGLQILDKYQTVMFNIRGQREHLPTVRAQITTKLKSLLVSREIPLPPQLSITTAFHHKVETILKAYKYISYEIKEAAVVMDASASSSKLSRKVMCIEGEKELILNAQTELQAEVINYSSEAASDVHYPTEWEKQTETCEVFNVKKDSTEWLKLSTRFRNTMPASAKIKRIRRVQNKWLWEKYQRDMKRMSKKNNGNVNEKELFHGSGKTNAHVILDSEEGFDMRYSDKGMWGHANYFAEDARYSDDYAYSKPDGSKEMFVAKVLTGDSHECSSDNTLRMPPLKSSAAGSEVRLKQVRYDTVNGLTSRTRVYMTYSNDKAYPAYIIEYQCLPDLSLASSGYQGLSAYSRHRSGGTTNPTAPGAANPQYSNSGYSSRTTNPRTAPGAANPQYSNSGYSSGTTNPTAPRAANPQYSNSGYSSQTTKPTAPGAANPQYSNSGYSSRTTKPTAPRAANPQYSNSGYSSRTTNPRTAPGAANPQYSNSGYSSGTTNPTAPRAANPQYSNSGYSSRTTNPTAPGAANPQYSNSGYSSRTTNPTAPGAANPQYSNSGYSSRTTKPTAPGAANPQYSNSGYSSGGAKATGGKATPDASNPSSNKPKSNCRLM